MHSSCRAAEALAVMLIHHLWSTNALLCPLLLSSHLLFPPLCSSSPLFSPLLPAPLFSSPLLSPPFLSFPLLHSSPLLLSALHPSLFSLGATCETHLLFFSLAVPPRDRLTRSSRTQAASRGHRHHGWSSGDAVCSLNRTRPSSKCSAAQASDKKRLTQPTASVQEALLMWRRHKLIGARPSDFLYFIVFYCIFKKKKKLSPSVRSEACGSEVRLDKSIESAGGAGEASLTGATGSVTTSLSPRL